MLLHTEKWCDEIVMLSLPLNHHWQRVDGKYFAENLAFILAPQDNMTLIHPGGVERIDLLLDAEVVNDYIMLHAHESNLMCDGRLNHYLGKYQNLTTGAVSITKHANYILSNAGTWDYQSCLDAQDNLMIEISSFLSNKNTLDIAPTRGRRQQIIKKSLQVIHDTNDLSISIKRLCELCFCSPRTLENAFCDFLGMPPKQYLIRRRLNLIREVLKSKPSATLTDIVTHFGVTNIGRFSQDYQKFFGESPLVTKT
jgi:AraC-like DNA-binding protein